MVQHLIVVFLLSHDIQCFERHAMHSTRTRTHRINDLRATLRPICFPQCDLRASNIIQQQQRLQHLIQSLIRIVSRLPTSHTNYIQASLCEQSRLELPPIRHRYHA